VIQHTADPNLLAITAGISPPNPSELLASERMKALLANFLSGPDWIITTPRRSSSPAVVLRRSSRRHIRGGRRNDQATTR
jgi:Mrp family chromosome partitioning ATPase